MSTTLYFLPRPDASLSLLPAFVLRDGQATEGFVCNNPKAARSALLMMPSLNSGHGDCLCRLHLFGYELKEAVQLFTRTFLLLKNEGTKIFDLLFYKESPQSVIVEFMMEKDIAKWLYAYNELIWLLRRQTSESKHCREEIVKL